MPTRTCCRRTFALLLPAIILFACLASHAAAQAPTLENESLRVTAEKAGAFTIHAKPSNKLVVTGRLDGVSGDSKKQTVNDPIFGNGEAIEWDGGKISLFPKLPFALLQPKLKNDAAEHKVLNGVKLATYDVTLGKPAAELKTLGTGGLLQPGKDPGSYAWLTVADPKTRQSVVGGFLSHDRAAGVLNSKATDNAIQVEARADYGRLRLAPNTTTDGEIFAIGYFDDGRLGLEAWADAVAKYYKIKLPALPAGFCTWYAEKPYGRASNKDNIKILTDFVTEHLKPFGFDFVQIDDGWQEGASQKNGPNKNFTTWRTTGPYPDGLKGTADYVKEKGLIPGIWFMPFAGTHNDPWFADRQDWFVKRDDGKPYDMPWGGTALDMTNSTVREYVRDIVDRIAHQWGYTYFKLDGLYTGMAVNPRYINAGFKDDLFGDAVFSNPDKTNVEVYRDGLKLIREVAGPKVFILGCNVAQNMRTYGGSFGLVDAMRIGPDNSGNWKAWASRSPVLGSRHYFLNGRIWYNDPDPNYVRDSIETESARTIASWSAICGQLNSNSDWIPNLSPERVELLKRTMRSHGKTARPIDFFENDPPRYWLVTDETGPVRRDVIALFNFSDGEQDYDIPLGHAGLKADQQYAAFDYWAKEFLPTIKGSIKGKLPGHQCQIIAVRPTQDRPFLLGTSLHVTQGMTDVTAEKWDDATKTLSGKSKVVGVDPYELRIATGNVPGWTVARTELSAADQAAGAKITHTQAEKDVRVQIESPTDREVEWKIVFTKE